MLLYLHYLYNISVMGVTTPDFCLMFWHVVNLSCLRLTSTRLDVHCLSASVSVIIV